MTRVFSTKKELAERLMAGEKWKAVESEICCYYDESFPVPFRASDGASICGAWNYCDGKTEWEKVKNKPKTKTVWFWKVQRDCGLWFSAARMFTEEEVKAEYPNCKQYKRLDALGSEEVEV